MARTAIDFYEMSTLKRSFRALRALLKCDKHRCMKSDSVSKGVELDETNPMNTDAPCVIHKASKDTSCRRPFTRASIHTISFQRPDINGENVYNVSMSTPTLQTHIPTTNPPRQDTVLQSKETHNGNQTCRIYQNEDLIKVNVPSRIALKSLTPNTQPIRTPTQNSGQTDLAPFNIVERSTKLNRSLSSSSFGSTPAYNTTCRSSTSSRREKSKKNDLTPRILTSAKSKRSSSATSTKRWKSKKPLNNQEWKFGL